LRRLRFQFLALLERLFAGLKCSDLACAKWCAPWIAKSISLLLKWLLRRCSTNSSLAATMADSNTDTVEVMAATHNRVSTRNSVNVFVLLGQ